MAAYGIPSPPQNASVGQTNVPVSFTVASDGPGTPTTVGLITVVLSCTSPGGAAPGAYSSCPAPDYEPGVLRPSPTGTGQAGSDCAGMTFTITQIDPLQDKYKFDSGAPFTITNRCVIDYTVDVLRQPTRDASFQREGIQTWQLGFASDGSPENGSCFPGCGSNVLYGVDPPQAPDADGDGVADTIDNCPNAVNPDQANQDGDALGDACDPNNGDPDADNDGVPDSADQCPGTASGMQVAADGCADPDGDGISTDAGDNCPTDSNPAQADTDRDGKGDACDSNNSVPTHADQCKTGGWMNYGTTFKNQGDCVSFVATGGKNEPGKKTKK